LRENALVSGIQRGFSLPTPYLIQWKRFGEYMIRDFGMLHLPYTVWLWLHSDFECIPRLSKYPRIISTRINFSEACSMKRIFEG
jgi:hypothetical protein